MRPRKNGAEGDALRHAGPDHALDTPQGRLHDYDFKPMRVARGKVKRNTRRPPC